MTTAPELVPEDLDDFILPTPHNGLIRRVSPVVEGEYRLLWAVLEDAIRTYLASRARLNVGQRRRFEDVKSWFKPARDKTANIFSFQTICDLLEIDSWRLLKKLDSAGAKTLPVRRFRYVRSARVRTLAA